MRNIVLIYHLVVFLLSFIVNIFYFLENSFQLYYIAISQLICLLGIYFSFILVRKNNSENRMAYNFLFGINLVQIFPFSIYGLTVKIIFGSFLLLSLRRFGLNADLIYKTELNLYLNQFYIKYEPNSKIFYFGINAIQLVFSIYFFRIIRNMRLI